MSSKRTNIYARNLYFLRVINLEKALGGHHLMNVLLGNLRFMHVKGGRSKP